MMTAGIIGFELRMEPISIFFFFFLFTPPLFWKWEVKKEPDEANLVKKVYPSGRFG